MKLYSYIVARDYGFAPNPFCGHCTLATCKPRIRSVAQVGDWVVGTGAKTKYNLAGHLIYAMRVDEAITFDQYWNDRRFLHKRPVLNGSLMQIYGDNIYHRDLKRDSWVQADSHHSYEGGRRNQKNIARDTPVDRVLISRKFVYYGRSAPEIPDFLRQFRSSGEDVCARTQGHIKRSPELAKAFVAWMEKRAEWGYRGPPLEFRYHKRRSA